MKATKTFHGKASRHFAIVIALAIFAALLVLMRSADTAAQSAPPNQTGAASAANAQRGKTIYAKVGCWECHGYDGQSGGNTGPKLGPPPMPFAAFTNQLRTPRNNMPPYTAKVLSDADVADIYAFVQSLPQPPKADSIPLLK